MLNITQKQQWRKQKCICHSGELKVSILTPICCNRTIIVWFNIDHIAVCKLCTHHAKYHHSNTSFNTAVVETSWMISQTLLRNMSLDCSASFQETCKNPSTILIKHYAKSIAWESFLVWCNVEYCTKRGTSNRIYSNPICLRHSKVSIIFYYILWLPKTNSPHYKYVDVIMQI